jgi:hypothetical protein
MTRTELEMLREYLRLDPTIPSGLCWIKSTNGRIKPGQPAGSPNSDGYYQFRLHRKHYKCHRVILLLNGVHPPREGAEVDHIDRNSANNLISNLRWVDRAANVRNCGVKGQILWRYVSPAFGRLKSQYVHPATKKKTHVGTYDNAYEAHCQALAHRLENHWINQ